MRLQDNNRAMFSGGNSASVSVGPVRPDGRRKVTYTLIGAAAAFIEEDLTIPGNLPGDPNLRALAALLGFICAAAEAYAYPGESDNDDLFPPHWMPWTNEVADEAAMLLGEIES